MSMANSIGHGDFSTRFRPRPHHDEIATLGIALNTMSEELSTLYSELEQRVIEKTHDLQQKIRFSLIFITQVNNCIPKRHFALA
ncbi:HAMP domain-containing protein [Proteus mirabilis]|uniref:HAMP domain-containing protein n=1 Tax=Proteus mirabilis TaxID=584 RepID=UPI000A95B446|nr:HAMP domain-containing protein [Proteus mirabilis]